MDVGEQDSERQEQHGEPPVHFELIAAVEVDGNRASEEVLAQIIALIGTGLATMRNGQKRCKIAAMLDMPAVVTLLPIVAN